MIDPYVAWMAAWAAGLVACYWAGFAGRRGPRPDPNWDSDTEAYDRTNDPLDRREP